MNGQPAIKSSGRAAAIAVALLSALAICGAAFLAGDPAVPFANYFGAIPPVRATLIVVVLAALAHWLLRSMNAFHVLRAGRPYVGLAVAVTAGMTLAVPTVVADMVWNFPRDINVAPPQAFLFYPLMGYVAETVFHLAPLTAVLLVARAAAGACSDRAVRFAILLAAAVEPVFQAWGAFGADTVAALDIFMLAHLYLFGIILLAVYRRYGFVTAFVLRLAYYLVWHILWGVGRLSLLY
jgi:hypothetical protein